MRHARGDMHEDAIYGLSDKGHAELRGSATTLPALDLELLVRIDGQLTVSQLRAGMAQVSDLDFRRTFNALRGAGLIEEVQLDTFALQLESGLSMFSQGTGEEADSGLRSLKRAGYFVRIARPQTRTAPATGRALKAVVVEDDAQLARFVSSYLTFEGFTVLTASNRDEVLAVMRKAPVPDLVLLDVVLPDADGFQILGSLRKHAAFRNVPVIMLTGKATREAVLQGLAGGADGYITKPFETDALMDAVHTVLGRPARKSGP
jgi:two-component system, OmpR family, response regulator